MGAGRIRTIKPELPMSESLGTVSREARLSLILLLTIVDDSGRCRGGLRLLSSQLFPYDSDAPELIGGWISELEKIGSIFFYVVDGNRYLQITKWHKHQKIEKPTASRLPEFDETSPTCRRILSDGSPPGPWTMDLGPSILDQIPPTPLAGIASAQTALPGAASSTPGGGDSGTIGNESGTIGNESGTAGTKKSRKPKPSPEPIMIPDNLSQHPDFLPTWNEWEKDRRERKKPLTAAARNKQLKMLDTHGPVKAIAMLNASITNGWSGLFPADDKRTGRNGSTQPDCLDAANYVGAPCMSDAEIGGVPY